MTPLKGRVILHIMLGGDVNPFPIQLLVNYWEKPISSVGIELDRLMKAGVTQIATYVPWQAVETDLFHTLPKFITAAAERQIEVTLIMTPEVGVSYPNSGLPKDLVGRTDVIAHHQKGKSVGYALPPQTFALPSLLSQELTRRYFSFLSRLDSTLAELQKSQPSTQGKISAILTGSFWKYYRPADASAVEMFSGVTGDFSTQAMSGFRQHTDRYYSQAEFQYPNATAANRWKTRAFEEVNQRAFFQYSEELFRSRSSVTLRKRSQALPVHSLELFTPEADPSLHSQQLMSALLDAPSMGAASLAKAIEQFSLRASGSSEGKNAPFIAWTELGLFRKLTDSEKQFLLLQSLLLMGGQGGGVFIPEREWFALSNGFRNRLEILARLLARGALKAPTRAAYLTPHLWSGQSTLWNQIETELFPNARLFASLERVCDDTDVRLLLVDPGVIFTEERVHRLLQWAQQPGRVLALPRSPLFTEKARMALEPLTHTHDPLEVELGVRYRVFGLGSGKVILFDLPEGMVMGGELREAWNRFAQGLIALADLQPRVRVKEQDRMHVLLMDRRRDEQALFLLNPKKKPQELRFSFTTSSGVVDLFKARSPQPGSEVSEIHVDDLSLQVPAFGAISLSVRPYAKASTSASTGTTALPSRERKELNH